MALVLIAVEKSSFLAFHTLAEFFAIVISCSMFILAWYTKELVRNGFLLFLACGYFWVGAMDLAHILIYPGMNVFPGVDGNLTVQFWLLARAIEALMLLAAPLVTEKIKSEYWLFTFFGVTAVSMSLLILYGFVPDTFVSGEGLTSFKIYSEYSIIAVLALALATLFRHQKIWINCLNLSFRQIRQPIEYMAVPDWVYRSAKVSLKKWAAV